jgi:hypothetical protein
MDERKDGGEEDDPEVLGSSNLHDSVISTEPSMEDEVGDQGGIKDDDEPGTMQEDPADNEENGGNGACSLLSP